MSWGSVVAGANDSAFPHEDTPDSSFHTVTPLCREGGKLHKVLIPTGAQTLLIGKIQYLERLVKLLQG